MYITLHYLVDKDQWLFEMVVKFERDLRELTSNEMGTRHLTIKKNPRHQKPKKYIITKLYIKTCKIIITFKVVYNFFVSNKSNDSFQC